MEPGDHHALLLEEYKLGVQYLTNHLTRLWTRFSFFLTLETALVVALLSLLRDGQDGRLSPAALVIPGVAVLLSVSWYVTGAQDRFLVVVYRHQIGDIVRRLIPDPNKEWPYLGEDIDDLEPKLEKSMGKIPRNRLQWRRKFLSITRMPAWFPLLTIGLWLGALVWMGWNVR
jgi:hypothetical protein